MRSATPHKCFACRRLRRRDAAKKGQHNNSRCQRIGPFALQGEQAAWPVLNRIGRRGGKNRSLDRGKGRGSLRGPKNKNRSPGPSQGQEKAIGYADSCFSVRSGRIGFNLTTSRRTTRPRVSRNKAVSGSASRLCSSDGSTTGLGPIRVMVPPPPAPPLAIDCKTRAIGFVARVQAVFTSAEPAISTASAIEG